MFFGGFAREVNGSQKRAGLRLVENYLDFFTAYVLYVGSFGLGNGCSLRRPFFRVEFVFFNK